MNAMTPSPGVQAAPAHHHELPTSGSALNGVAPDHYRRHFAAATTI